MHTHMHIYMQAHKHAHTLQNNYFCIINDCAGYEGNLLYILVHNCVCACICACVHVHVHACMRVSSYHSQSLVPKGPKFGMWSPSNRVSFN